MNKYNNFLIELWMPKLEEFVLKILGREIYDRFMKLPQDKKWKLGGELLGSLEED